MNLRPRIWIHTYDLAYAVTYDLAYVLTYDLAFLLACDLAFCACDLAFLLRMRPRIFTHIRPRILCMRPRIFTHIRPRKYIELVNSTNELIENLVFLQAKNFARNKVSCETMFHGKF